MASKGLRNSLAAECSVNDVDNSIRLEKYYQLSRQMLLQGKMYLGDEDFDHAYVFLKRFMNLLVNTIPAHNSYGLPQYSKDKNWGRRESLRAMQMLEETVDRMDSREEELGARSQVDSMSVPSPGETVHVPPTAPTSEAASIPPAPGGSAEATADELARALAALRMPYDKQSPTAPQIAALYPPSASVRPPVAMDSSASRTASSAAASAASSAATFEPPPAYAAVARPPPSAAAAASEVGSALSTSSISSQIGGRGMRTLVMPSRLVQAFASIAAPNTNRGRDGVETCGILAGALRKNSLVLTHLIIPPQTGSSDTVAMTNEEVLFEYCMERDLLILGWIHTHPRQSCFLSSVDVHTHCGFQTMLPEAIAVVYAPSDRRKNIGVFRLTEPEGLKLIQRCTLTGFHPHPDHITIYNDATRAVNWMRDGQESRFETVDLR